MRMSDTWKLVGLVTTHYVLSHNALNRGSFQVLFFIKYSAQYVSKLLYSAPCSLHHVVSSFCSFCVDIPEDGPSTGRNM